MLFSYDPLNFNLFLLIKVLSERSENWETGKKESLARIQELIEIFAGNKQVMRVKKSG